MLGHAYGPRLPQAGSDEQSLGRAARDWATFFSERRDEKIKTLGYLYLTDGRAADAAKLLEKVVLMARRYEPVSPVRIEVVWPRVILGDCYWAVGQQSKAAAEWQVARSCEICAVQELDDWDRLGLPWVEKGRSRLVDNGIPVPSVEDSERSSQHLRRALEHLLEAEEYEFRSGDLDQLVDSLRLAGNSYRSRLSQAAIELDEVKRLDPFTWARVPISDSPRWFRHDHVKGIFLQKMGLLQVSNGQLALGIANYKQAGEVWPMLSAFAVMGELQAACGLTSDAKNTFQACLLRTEELGAVESSEDSEDILRHVRHAITDLSG